MDNEGAEVDQSLLSIDWNQVLSYLLKLGLSFLLALPVAWERERDSRSMGLRTFPIVAVASCGYLLVGMGFASDSAEAQARIVQGLMTGMGFIGGGAILKVEDKVRGTATAASLWTTGIIGAAVAHGFYEIAVVVSLINFLVLQLFTRLKNTIDAD